MSITDELREWAHGPDEGDDWLDRIDEFCDRIDREHRMAMEKVAADAYLDGAPTEAQLEELGYIALPLDADGVPIHIGDVVEDADAREIVEQVMQIRYTLATSSNAPAVLTSIITNESQLQQKPSNYRHHHTPTVEDVLEEMLREYDRDDSELTNGEIIERFAAKLRLAEEVD